MKKLLFVIFAIGLFLAACSNQPNTPVTGTWNVVSYGSASNPKTALPDLNRSLIFDKKGNFSGNVGCNSFSGTYTIDGTKIAFQPKVSTKLTCPPDVIMKQEQAILDVLNGSADFKIDDRYLTITNNDEVVMMEVGGN